jgi:hypothetical protein
MHISDLRPRAIDVWASGRSGLPAKTWQFLRGSTVDRAILWGLVITLVLPAVAPFLGITFAFGGSLLSAVALSGAFWLFVLAASILAAIITRPLLGTGAAARRVQVGFSLLSFGGGLVLLAHWFALSFSTFGLLLAVAALHLVSTWALGGVCKDGVCEIPKKK